RQALHHRRSRHYVKPYLPYLPMITIVGLGAAISKAWVNPGTSARLDLTLPTNRLGSLTGHTSINLFYGVLIVTFVAFAIFGAIHWYRVRRMLNRGEAFIVNHPWVDIGL